MTVQVHRTRPDLRFLLHRSPDLCHGGADEPSPRLPCPASNARGSLPETPPRRHWQPATAPRLPAAHVASPPSAVPEPRITPQISAPAAALRRAGRSTSVAVEDATRRRPPMTTRLAAPPTLRGTIDPQVAPLDDIFHASQRSCADRRPGHSHPFLSPSSHLQPFHSNTQLKTPNLKQDWWV